GGVGGMGWVAEAGAGRRGNRGPLGDAGAPRLHRIGRRAEVEVGRGQAGDRRRRRGVEAAGASDAGALAPVATRWPHSLELGTGGVAPVFWRMRPKPLVWKWV